MRLRGVVRVGQGQCYLQSEVGIAQLLFLCQRQGNGGRARRIEMALRDRDHRRIAGFHLASHLFAALHQLGPVVQRRQRAIAGRRGLQLNGERTAAACGCPAAVRGPQGRHGSGSRGGGMHDMQQRAQRINGGALRVYHFQAAQSDNEERSGVCQSAGAKQRP